MPKSLSLFDARPFFEKALVYGVENHIISPQKLEVICTDAPKGMVQIARYFGNEFLRPDLEKAKDRIVNLVSLYLEHTTTGDLQQAAESLRDNSFMSRSKGGADMLKALIAMPQSSHFDMNDPSGFTDDQIPLLAEWTLKSLPDYQAELVKRSEVANIVDAAIWMAHQLELDATKLEKAGTDAEAVIRTALLVFSVKGTEVPDWVAFEKMVLTLRKKYGASKDAAAATITLPKNLPFRFGPVVELIQQTVLVDLVKILDSRRDISTLFKPSPDGRDVAFMGRYFWQEDFINEIDQRDRTVSKQWSKMMGKHIDEGALLTVFLCLAAKATPRTELTKEGSATLVRKIRKHGLQPELAIDFIMDHAPVQYQGGYEQRWLEFIEEAQASLLSDHDYSLGDALALLRCQCNVKQ